MKRILLVLLGAAIAAGVAAQSKKEAAKKPAVKAEKAAEKKASEPPQSGQSFENAKAMCEGCHGIRGYKTAFPDVYHVPRIAGQQPQYLVNALKAYKSGERSHPSMRGIAASLTEADMQKLAEYYGGTK